MAVKGKGKQIAGKAPVNSSTKRKSPSAQAECSAAGGKKKRRGGVLRFFDDAAADADLDEEEEEDLDDDDVDLEDEEVDLDFGNEQSKYEKGTGKANPLPFFLKEEEMSGDELEALIRDRYAGGSDYVVYDEDKEYGDIAAAELSLKDATIWRVKCMFGREQQIAFSLMQKFIDLQEFGTKLRIISVFALEHIKGYVYIEADKASDVAEACKGFCNIYSSRIGLVPSNEIPHLLVVRNKVCEVSKGTWVRMKNGKYKGDLGQVVAVDESRKRATIKMIPRVDLEAIAKKYGGGISLKNSAVPAQRLISSHELGHFGPHVEIRRDRETGEIFEVLDGLMFKDGYLYKKMAIGSLVHWGVQPTEHEILKFTETSKAEDGDLDWLSSIYEGRKRMRSTEASTSNGVTKEGSGYDLHELVFFGRKDFGVIISLGKDGIQILKGDAEGQVVVTVKSQEIKKGCDDKMFTASDCHMKTISINDLVKVSEGPMEGRQGIVRHMYKGTLFLYDENQENNSGIFRAKSNICENIKQSRAFGKSGKKSSSSFSIPPMTSCDQEDNPRTFDRYRRESDQTFSIGQTLRIKKGPLKGYLCRVVGVYRKNVTVKLDSLVKTITVEEQFLSVPNIRSDGCAVAPIGGLSDKGREPLGQSSWDSGRDSWQSLTSSSFPFANNNDQKSDQGEGDPWGSKMPLTTKDQGEGDPWGSKLPLTTNDQGEGDPWGSKLPLTTNDADKEQAAADPWGSKGAVVSRAESSDPWGSKVSVASEGQAAADPWGSKGAVVSRAESSDPWGKKVSVASKDQEQAAADTWGSKGAVVSRAESSDPWGSKVSVASKDQEQAAADPWGSKGAVVSRAEPSDAWGSKVPVASKDREQAAADPWGSKGAVVARAEPSDPWGSKVPVASKDREQAAADPWSSSKGAVVSRDKKDQGDANPWGSSKMVTVTEDHGQRAESADPWGSKVSLASKANQEKSVVDPWGSKVSHASAHKEHGAADPWSSKGAATSKDQGQGDEWGRKAEFDDSSNKTTDNLGMTSATEQNSPWNAVTGEIKPHTGNLGNDADGWNKHSVKSTSRTAGWGNVKQPGVGDGESWGGKNNSSNAESVTTCGNSSSQAHPEADSWGIKGKSIVNSEVAWDKATEKSSVEDGGKTSSWDKVKTPISSQADQWGKGTSNATGSGGWNKSGFSNQSQKGEWNEEAVGNNQMNDWNKSGDFGGGRGFGQGRGRGRNTWGDNTSGDQEGKWNKPINREGGGGSTWGSGWNHNAAAGGSQDQENSWSKQSDSPGGRGFGRDRGRGRYGGSGNRDDNQTKPYDSGGDWGRGRGRGRGRNGDAGNFSNNFDDAGSFGRGRGRFDSSDWKNNQENFGDGNLSKKSASSWGNDEQGEWTGGKSAVQGQSSDWNTPKAQGDNQPSSWNQTSSTPGKQSSGWATNEEKSWATTPKASPSGSQFSAWNKTAENKDAGKEACGAGGGWGSIKQFDDKKASDGNGAPGAGGNWDKAKPFDANQLSDWSSREKKDWSSGKQLGQSPAGNASDDAYAGGDSWSKPGLLGVRPAETNNWNEARSSGWKHNSPASEGKAGTNVSNWNKPKTFSGGNQSSGWGNDEGESWSKPNSFGGQSSWSDHTDGFNAGEGGEQSGGWGRGRNDQSCGGRGNSFSGRGRGRGRNFGGGRWNGGRGGNQEGNGSGDQPQNFSRGNTFASGQSSSWNQGGFASGGGSWNKGNESAGEHTGKNAGETADKGSWDYSWKSESGKQPGGWAKQDSKGFEPPSPDGSYKSGGGNWHQPKQSGNSSGSGWATGKTNAWNEKKPSDGKEQASGGWNTSAIPAKEDGIGSSSKEADIGGNVGAWEKKEADIGGNGSAWEKKAAGSWGNPKDGNSGGKGGW